MSIHASATTAPPSNRPVVSSVEDGPAGKSFRLRFEPGQELPAHRNASRVVITAVRGAGAITIGENVTRALPEGAFVQLDANALHAIVAGGDGLDLLVVVTSNCCGVC